MSMRLFTMLLVCLSLAACSESGDAAPASPSAAPEAATAPAVKATPEAPQSAVETVPALESLLRPEDTLATAQARLGAAQVIAEELNGAEGETSPGWRLYPDDPERSIEVWLNESGRPQALFVRGPKSIWVRADGVRLGMTSTDLQAKNGRPFKFLGFEWDYGGAISDWRGGALAADGKTRGPVVLCPPDPHPMDYPAGDSEFASDDPRMVSNPAIVCEFGVNLDFVAPAATPPAG
ncbi:hypothetical protein [Lysobacter brunescens]|uniref:Lipoprotein n=1 Tax=Lysobacter brunescens TaxID=262323 RepID=A0ABW2YEA1_9GAMM